MVNKQEIILRYFREGDSIRKICRDLGLHRDTVRRYLEEYREAKAASEKNGDKSLLHHTLTEGPKYTLKEARPRKKLSPSIQEEIDKYLAENARKTAEGLVKQRMRKVDIHEALVKSGFCIGYTTVSEYIRQKVYQAREAFIRQEYPAGSSCEFDWAEVHLYFGGHRKRLYMAVFTSSYSNYRYALLFERQDGLAFMEAHRCFFTHVGGVFYEMVYDNMRVAVTIFVGKSEKKPTRTLLSLSGWYHFRFRFCNAYRGNEKGHVERSVEVVRRKAFGDREHFTDIFQASAHLERVCGELNEKKVTGQVETPVGRFAIEKPSLYAYPGPIECFMSEELKVDKYSTVCYRTNRYSVPDHLVGKIIAVKVYSRELQMFWDGNKVCAHQRVYEKHEWRISLHHYLHTLARKPAALKGSVALSQSDIITQVYMAYFFSEAREFIDLLIFCKENEVSDERLRETVWKVEKLCPSEVRCEKVMALLGNKPPQEAFIMPLPGIIEELATEHLKEMSALMQMN